MLMYENYIAILDTIDLQSVKVQKWSSLWTQSISKVLKYKRFRTHLVLQNVKVQKWSSFRTQLISKALKYRGGHNFGRNISPK